MDSTPMDDDHGPRFVSTPFSRPHTPWSEQRRALHIETRRRWARRCGSWERDDVSGLTRREEGKASRLEVFTILEFLRNLDDMVRDTPDEPWTSVFPNAVRIIPRDGDSSEELPSTPNIFVSDRFDQPD